MISGTFNTAPADMKREHAPVSLLQPVHKSPRPFLAFPFIDPTQESTFQNNILSHECISLRITSTNHRRKRTHRITPNHKS